MSRVRTRSPFEASRLGLPASRPGSPVSELIDAAIAEAPECLRRRVILQAIDWRAVTPAQVASMLASLQSARMQLPHWLAQLLLMAGHVLPDAIGGRLPISLRILQRLNGTSGEPEEREGVVAMLEALSADHGADGDVVNALVQRLVKLGWADEAVGLALAHAHRTPAAMGQLGKHLDSHLARLPVVGLRLIGFSTTQLLADELQPAFAAEGWRAEVSQATYGDVLGELMNPQDHADAVVAFLDLEGFAPRDWRGSAEEGFALLAERAELLANAAATFAKRSRVPLLINTLPFAPAPTAGLLDRRHAAGLRRGIDFVNGRLLDAAGRSNQIVVVDSDQALADVPLSRQVDPKLWFYGRIAYSADATRALARAFAQAWRQTRCGPVKVVAVDLDNTLWGGVFGDDGVERLECGQEFPGNAFLAMQQECLRLKGQGLLLVALSKNNSDAMTAFERHPSMALKPADFAAAAINWDPKPQNIRKIAADLNLGLDSFLFLDDSPQERDAMRRLCPDVTVPEMPADPAERPLWVRLLTCTWPVRLTAEDATRAAMYAAGREANRLKASAATVEEFLRGLEQRLTVAHVCRQTVGRVGQMHQRTNQFNLTTVRCSEAEIAAYVGDAAHGVALLGSVRDKFGDHGIVIAATVAIDGEDAVIRSLLMSCRVIRREIERAFLGELLRELARRGVVRVRGDYVPTAKNGMVRDFYASCGFELVKADAERSTWSFTIGRVQPPGSQFVAIGTSEA